MTLDGAQSVFGADGQSVNDSPEHEEGSPEVSVVMPCLNEADTLADRKSVV